MESKIKTILVEDIKKGNYFFSGELLEINEDTNIATVLGSNGEKLTGKIQETDPFQDYMGWDKY